MPPMRWFLKMDFERLLDHDGGVLMTWINTYKTDFSDLPYPMLKHSEKMDINCLNHRGKPSGISDTQKQIINLSCFKLLIWGLNVYIAINN